MKTDSLLSLFFPPRCCGCDRITNIEGPVCSDCLKLVLHPSKRSSSCSICALDAKSCICKKHQYYKKLTACFIYEGTPVKTIFKLKFRSRPDIARNYSRLLLSCLEERDLIKDIDVITYIPMSRFSRFKRGYNQSELFAKHLSKYTDIPYMKLLKKQYKSSSQHKLGAVSRSGNLLGCFEPDKKKLDCIADKTVLVVDDVLTTGSTLNEITKTLLIFGADSVCVAACAATKKKKNIEHK